MRSGPAAGVGAPSVNAVASAVASPASSRAPNSDGARALERAERAADRELDDALDDPAVVESHLGFGRVHVDVERVGGHHELEKDRRTNAGGDRGPVRG